MSLSGRKTNRDENFCIRDRSLETIDSHRYLAHTGAPVDEEVWRTQDDVVQGRDTVVEAAVEWINSRHPRHPTVRRQPGLQ